MRDAFGSCAHADVRAAVPAAGNVGHANRGLHGGTEIGYTKGNSLTTLLGTTTDGRTLTYDASLYEFYLDDEQASFGDVQMLDARNWLRWRADVLRDWFVHIDSAALVACNARARSLAASRALGGAGRPKAALPARKAEAQIVSGNAAQESAGSAAAAGEPAATGSGSARTESADGERAQIESAAGDSARPVATANESARAEQASVEPEIREPVVVRLKSALSQSFKSKEGKLAKDKSFDLFSCIDAPVFFSKLSGTPYVIVSEDGRVEVFKGLESGSHVVQVQAVPQEAYDNVDVVETITIEVRVK